ncbi:YoaK family protein [Scatolibacter rhodanostii]|uniref:YoaK family protein n=1 Tax=Scatolibacter rhodanostii TaxID=2014781 RepID=UPI000C088115|nr:YoaK family protein [Scatolibacter rhodanostii]
MNTNAAHQKADSFFVSALLAIIGGFLDAYTYNLRDGVLANAQTGNMVFMVIRLTEGHLQQAFFYLIPIFFFMLGVFLVEKIRFYKHAPSAIHWQQIILAIEFFILLIVSFIPSGPLNMAVNIAIALTCSMQVESFRTVQGNPFASTMCTGNLRSGSESLFYYTQTRDQQYLKSALHYFGIITYFLIGVLLGSSLSHVLFEKATLVCCLLLLICLLMLKKSSAAPDKMS